MWFRKKELKSIFEVSNKRAIWRILCTNNGRLLLEEREKESRQVFYSIFNLSTGAPSLVDYQLDGEQFWTGIEEIKDNFVIFHKYIKPDLPIHKGLFIFDINSNAIVWQNTEANFLFTLGNEIFCYRPKFESKEYYSLSLTTGELLKEYGENHALIAQLITKSNEEKDYSKYRFPEQTSVGGAELPVNLKTHLDENGFIGRADIIEFDKKILLSFNGSKGDGFISEFIIYCKKSDEVLFSLNIAEKAKTFTYDAFFIIDNFLILLIEKSKLAVYDITKLK